MNGEAPGSLHAHRPFMQGKLTPRRVFLPTPGERRAWNLNLWDMEQRTKELGTPGSPLPCTHC